ncbi:MAG: DNA-directed RNA polymerase subunit beta [Bacilli bacterium]|jgi:DNA-directed RNA polymerase subunit beta|nr:DNA-directed RNA polymerase subunit beta [Bacilli bacterium]
MKTFEEIFNRTDIDYSYNHRANFSKISGQLSLPYLCEIQTESFQWLMKTGIDEVLKDFFPIRNNDQTMELDYVSLAFDQPKADYFECKTSSLTYSAPLHVVLRLQNKNNGEIKEGTIFMGDFPMMTESGTFIINGVEKVVESQIVRSSGAYMHKEEVTASATFTYGADIIPARGTWLEFLSDAKGMLYVRIDKQKKVPVTTLLRALGIVYDEEIYRIFGTSCPMLKKTMEKYPEPDITGNGVDKATAISIQALKEIYSKLRPGEPVDDKDVAHQIKTRFFIHRNYDLGPAGRFKLNSKLGAYDRLLNHHVAQDLVSADGELVVEKGTLITKEILEKLQEEQFFEKGGMQYEFPVNTGLDEHNHVSLVDVYADDEMTKVERVVGSDVSVHDEYVTPSDILACFSYFLNIIDGVGNIDDIDHLGNRRIRSVGELIQNQFRTGLSRMERIISDKMSVSKDMENVAPENLINIKPLTSCIKEFFNSSQLAQFMDQTNPLSELSNKRRISALGPGGLTRDRASFEVRDVHYSHYGRICPIETPEGQNIGLIANLACYAKINQFGFIETPYRRVVNKVVQEQADYLSADDERSHTIAQANVRLDPKTHEILDERVLARQNGETIMALASDVDYIDVSPKQIVSIASACIPFLENDDSTRAQMGGNMQRQALPLLHPHAPFVGTGLEHKIATDSGAAVIANNDGVVVYSDSKRIDVLEGPSKTPFTYKLKKFMRSNQGTCINQTSIVHKGDVFHKGDVIADGPAMDHGELALGQNVVIAFTTWHGYNYEDAVIMSERLVKDDVYTTLHIVEYSVDRRKTKNGKEEFTADIPNLSTKMKAHLDPRGVVTPGSEVKEGDILVGKTSPKGDTDPTPELKLLESIFLSKSKDRKDTSLRVPHGGGGIVLEVKTLSRKTGDDLPPNVLETIKVYVVQKRKISEGDKMSGRHGNKGVISRIVPIEDMPFLPDGTPVDILLNPLGVPSRMNIGQILEVHLGMACAKLGGLKVATPVFDGISNEEIMKMMKAAGMDEDGKTILYSGETGERFDSRINVGVMYMIKLVHMVDDKLHARATGPYSLVTQQPLGGKAQNGGQRFGEMEVWALEAYGAAHVLQEMLTIKSDDMVGRNECYEAILKNKPIPKPNMPESFRVLIKELQSLAIDVRLYTEGMKEIDISSITSESIKLEKSIKRKIYQMGEEEPKDDGDKPSEEPEEEEHEEEAEPEIVVSADPNAD